MASTELMTAPSTVEPQQGGVPHGSGIAHQAHGGATTHTRLRLPRQQVRDTLQKQIERGQHISNQVIKSQPDLDRVRIRRVEWVRETNQLLVGAFDNNRFADEFNDFVGRLLDEEADLHDFVELFNAEMKHRLKRLAHLYKRLEKRPDGSSLADSHSPGEPAHNSNAPAHNSGAPAQSSGAPAQIPVASAQSLVTSALSSVTPVNGPVSSPAAPVVASAKSSSSGVPASSVSLQPRGIRVPTATTSTSPNDVPRVNEPVDEVDDTPPDVHERGAIIAFSTDASARKRVHDFLETLGLDHDLLDGAGEGGLVQQIDSADDLSFALILAGPELSDQAGMSSRVAFELGFCAGRLGAQRLVVMSTEPTGTLSALTGTGLPVVPLDSADGWQLKLARQLKRAGIDVDLNRMM